jgi:hypothetical protein
MLLVRRFSFAKQKRPDIADGFVLWYNGYNKHGAPNASQSREYLRNSLFSAGKLQYNSHMR